MSYSLWPHGPCTPGLLSFIISQTLHKLMCIESVMPSNHLILWFPSSPALNLYQQQGVSQWGSSSHQAAKVLKLQLQRWCFQWLLRVDFLYTHISQFSSGAQSCPTICNPMNCSTPGLPVHHQLPEFTQIHVHRVSDAIQPSHPLSFPSPPAPNPSQQQGLFQCVNSLHEVAKVLEFQPQHQSFHWTPRIDLL